jgi:hypothetical protein
MKIYLPSDLSENHIAASIGLISDTHMPQRWAALPDAVFDVLDGVDLLLHAGDVGELWVLDQLSQIGPLVAVHGNDDTPATQRELPYQQVVVVAGQRMLLWHSHYPDRSEELASRQGEAMEARLDRLAERGRGAGAKIAISGHWHIPFAHQQGDVLLINPGALASGNHTLRQLRQTVALLFIRDDGAPFVSHVDLAQPDRIYHPPVDWGRGFQANAIHFSASILSPGLAEQMDAINELLFAPGADALRAAWLRVAHRCWAGEQAVMTGLDFLGEVSQDADISPAIVQKIEGLLAGLE